MEKAPSFWLSALSRQLLAKSQNLVFSKSQKLFHSARRRGSCFIFSWARLSLEHSSSQPLSWLAA
jgi:hypothetical protein